MPAARGIHFNITKTEKLASVQHCVQEKPPRGTINAGNVAWERPGWEICPWTHWARK